MEGVALGFIGVFCLQCHAGGVRQLRLQHGDEFDRPVLPEQTPGTRHLSRLGRGLIR